MATLAEAMEPVARLLLGEPNKRMSNKRELRFGKNGSIAVDLSRGLFHDHENDDKGGVLKLIELKKGLKGKDAAEWIKSQGIPLDDDRRPRANGRAHSAAEPPPDDEPPPWEPDEGHAPASQSRRIVAVYPYLNLEEILRYEVVRFEPKGFGQRRPHPTKANVWIWGLTEGTYVRHDRGQDYYAQTKDRTPEKGWNDRIEVESVAHGLYRHGELREEMLQEADERRIVFIPEGEKDCDTLHAWGCVAATNSGGAQNWRPEHADELAGADVVIPVDNDKAGRERGEKIAKSLKGKAKRIRILDLKPFWPGMAEKDDVTDWKVKAAGTKEKLFEIVDKLPDWTPAPYVSKLGGAFVHEFIGTKPPTRDWLLDDVFLANTLFLIVGEGGCGKSFLTLDWSLTAAFAAANKTEKPEWFGREIKPCGVVYIAAEGQDDFIIRIHAWLIAKGLPPTTKLPFFLIPTPIDMRTSDAQTRELIADIKAADEMCREQWGCGVGFTIIDTVNKSLAGGDDSRADHIGAFIKNCALIRAETKIATGGLHHTPRGAERARGHGSITYDNDAEVFVRKSLNGAPNSWTVTRNKAGMEGARHEFRVRQIEFGDNGRGKPLTSCVIAPGAQIESATEATIRETTRAFAEGKPTMTPDGRIILGDNLTMVLRALQDALREHGEFAPPGIKAPHGARVVKQSDWTSALIRIAPGEDKDDAKFKERCRKARESAQNKLSNRKIIGVDDNYVWRTSRRVFQVDEAEREEREPVRKLPETAISSPGVGEDFPF